MRLGPLAFLSPVLPPRPRRLNTGSRAPSAVASQPQDQWEQYESRSQARHERERHIARAAPARDRHHQVFLTNASKSTFGSASQRFMASMRTRYGKEGKFEVGAKRLWVVESIADDTFGTLRGAPYPPRVVVMESVDVVGDGGEARKEADAAVSRWTAALNRAGKALSTIESYHVEYAVWGGASSVGGFHQLQRGHLVACEVLNADWTAVGATEGMRDLLLAYAQEAVGSGKVDMYQVLQSVDEPTMFKTVETYVCMDDLREHMSSLDPDFAKDAMRYRAAVNRVRQLYRCVDSLHGVS